MPNQIYITRRDVAQIRRWRVSTVCLVILCIVLLAAVVTLWRKFNMCTLEIDRFKIRSKQLETRHNRLSEEQNQLQMGCSNLTAKREQLQEKIDEFKRHLAQGWRYFDSAFYYLSTEEKNWTESRQHCRSQVTDLVIINSKQEQDFVVKVLGGSRAWIGLSDQENEGDWKWLDGANVTTTYWENGEPNSSGNENCAELLNQSWNDFPCINHIKWICEKSF